MNELEIPDKLIQCTLEFATETISISEKTPNDMELGLEVRRLIQKYNNNVLKLRDSLEVLDNSQ